MASRYTLPLAVGTIVLFGVNLSTLEASDENFEAKPVSVSTRGFTVSETPVHFEKRGWKKGSVGETPALMNQHTRQIFGSPFKSKKVDPTQVCASESPEGFWRAATQWDIRFAQALKLPRDFYGTAEFRVAEPAGLHGRVYSGERAFFSIRTWQDWVSLAKENGVWKTMTKPAPTQVFCVAGPGLNTPAELDIYLNPAVKREVISLIGHSMYEQYASGEFDPEKADVARTPASAVMEETPVITGDSIQDVTVDGAAFRATRGIALPK